MTSLLCISLFLVGGTPPAAVPTTQVSPTNAPGEAAHPFDVIAALEDARAGTARLQAFTRPPNPPNVRSRAFLALARNGNDADRLEGTLKAGFADRDTAVRRMVAFAIGQLGDARLAGLLVNQVRNEPERTVVQEIWKALGRVGADAALKAAATAPRWYRPWAVSAAGLIARRLKRAPWEVPPIRAALDSTEPALLSAALYAVSRGHFKTGPKAIRDLVVKHLASSDADVRREAARALSGHRFDGLDEGTLANVVAPAVAKMSPQAAHWMLRGWLPRDVLLVALPAAQLLPPSAPATAKGTAVAKTNHDPAAALKPLLTSRFHLWTAIAKAANAHPPSAPGKADEAARTQVRSMIARWTAASRAPNDRSISASHLRRATILECALNPVLPSCATTASGIAATSPAKAGRLLALFNAKSTSPGQKMAVLQALGKIWKSGDKRALKLRRKVLARALADPDGPVVAVAADTVVRQKVDDLQSELMTAQRRFRNNVEVAADLVKAVVAAGSTSQKAETFKWAASSSERAIRLLAKRLSQSDPKSVVTPRAMPVPATLDTASAFAARTSAVVGAWLHTDMGDVAIALHPKLAPLTVANFVRLARKGYYDKVKFHRVVPGFVAQAGDPRGDGWGGPGYTIRCENNPTPYNIGTVGMALAGKDTGGSQWFITLQPQPHLLGTYTVFGQVVKGMDVVRRLAAEDRIQRITIVERPPGAALERPWTP